MGFSQYSQVVQPSQYQVPIDTNVLVAGSKFKEQTSQQNLKEIQTELDSILGVPSWGRDHEKMVEVNSTLQEQIKGLSMANLNDPSTTTTIKNLIKSVANSPDVQAIAQRGFQFQEMQKEAREALKVGKNYLNPGYEEAQKYYSSGEYIRDKGFNNNGFISPDLAKLRGEVYKNTPKVKKQVFKDGRWLTEESYDEGALKEGLNSMYSDPNVQKLINYNLDNKYKDVDWNVEAANHLNSFKSVAEDNYNKAYSLQQSFQQGTPEYQKYGALVNKYQKELGQINTMAQDPAGHVDEYKRSIFNEEKQNQIAADLANSQFYSQEGIKADEFALDAQHFNHRLAEISLHESLIKDRELAKAGINNIDRYPEYQGLKDGSLVDTSKPIYVGDTQGKQEYYELDPSAANVLNLQTEFRKPSETGQGYSVPDIYAQSKDGKTIVGLKTGDLVSSNIYMPSENKTISGRHANNVFAKVELNNLASHSKDANKKGSSSDFGKKGNTPSEGETKTVDGFTFTYKNGKWQ